MNFNIKKILNNIKKKKNIYIYVFNIIKKLYLKKKKYKNFSKFKKLFNNKYYYKKYKKKKIIKKNIKNKKKIYIYFKNGFFFKKKLYYFNKKIIIKKISIYKIYKYIFFLKKYNFFSIYNILLSLLNYNNLILIKIKKNLNKLKLILNFLFKIKKKKKIIINTTILIVVEKNNFLKIKEKYFFKKKKKILNNLLILILIKKKSKVFYLKFKNNNNYFKSINNLFIYQDYLSKFILYDLYLNEKITINIVNIFYLKNKCKTNINGIILANKNQIIENYIYIYNNYNYCYNNQKYINILSDKTYTILNSITTIKKKTKKNISLQNYKSFILSKKIFFFSKPQLNIFSKNVKCSHGVTIGKIDKNIIFYLQTKGINIKNSKIIFFLSFLNKILNIKFINKKIKKKIIKKLKLICNNNNV
ncbi:MAG: SufD family Fe-S cluster assembly protein [Candidatus Shikimatogenerans bostrichidophilus]|nr:MAG: SufD family Fe-S cluster assembly protein [Candidatus Shikimatogenerans bostrichidophilus]